ncbi:uncharacterized protein METZ01_LOCUS111825 [marine metagenome]|uniref:Thioredoxin domain-containing protein n=1 Tax=marine metagenome TaxID=408172 RepID=A0A381X397_9ZZZZ
MTKHLTFHLMMLMAFLFITCTENSKPITIKGSISNPINDKAYFTYSDTSYIAFLNQNGSFEVTFIRDSSEYVTFVHGERTEMYIKPGVQIILTVDTREFDETIKYENSLESSFLAEKYITTEKKDFYGESLYLKDEDQYQSYLNEYKDALLKELGNFNDEYFKATELKELNISMERRLKQKQNLSGRSKEELSYLWDAKSLSQEYDFYGLIKSSNQSEFINILVEYEKKMFKSLDKLKNIDGFEEEKEKISRLIRQWKERKYNHDNMPKDGELAIDFSYPDIEGTITSLSSFKGNLVYVDVWATWCGPCIAELPALEKLQENYKDKNITFLSVSVDTDKDAWEKLVTDDGLGGVQLWADGWSDITKFYAIFGIPRFLLIDKDGSLISVDAPRPSSSEIRTLLDNAGV